MKAFSYLLLAGFALSSCSSSTEPTYVEQDNIEEPTQPEPTPNYDSQEGDVYFYVASVSEEDRKQGRAAGSVSMFRFLGRDGDDLRIAILNDEMRQIGVARCPNSCRVIRVDWNDGRVTRIGFNSASLIGSAFEDAINGLLRPVNAPEPATNGGAKPGRNELGAATIPNAFVGEWNSEKSACGSDLSDARLRIEPERLRFFESDGDVKKVTVHDRQSATVVASFSSEGQDWTSSLKLKLSDSGNELTVDDYTRQRCP